MDFAPRDNFSVVAEAIRHASIACAGRFAPIKIDRASVTLRAEGGGTSPGFSLTVTGEVSASFNLDACMSMAGWNGQGSVVR